MVINDFLDFNVGEVLDILIDMNNLELPENEKQLEVAQTRAEIESALGF